MFEDNDSDLFQGTPSEIAEQQAESVHQAIRVLRGWEQFLDNSQEDTKRDQAQIADTIGAVETALEKMESLYPQLAVHAALLQIREETVDSKSLPAHEDRTFR